MSTVLPFTRFFLFLRGSAVIVTRGVAAALLVLATAGSLAVVSSARS